MFCPCSFSVLLVSVLNFIFVTFWSLDTEITKRNLMENEEERESVHPIICFDYKNINLGKEMFNGGGVPFEHAQKTHIKTLIITN